MNFMCVFHMRATSLVICSLHLNGTALAAFIIHFTLVHLSLSSGFRISMYRVYCELIIVFIKQDIQSTSLALSLSLSPLSSVFIQRAVSLIPATLNTDLS